MAKTRSGQKRRAATAKARQAKAKPQAPAPPAASSTAPPPTSSPAAAATGIKAASATATAAPPRTRDPRPRAGRPAAPARPASPFDAFADRLGVPPVPLALGASAWLLVLVLFAAHAVGGGFAVFLGAVLSAAVAVGHFIASIARTAPLLETLRAGVVLGLAGTIPVVFDPHTGDVFNLPRYTLVVIGALVLAGLAAIAAAHERRAPAWRVGLQWPIAAVVVWTLVTTLTSEDVNVSLLGNYSSYDGFYATLAFATIAMTVAGTIRAQHVRKVLGALAFAGGGVVVLYGLIQLHDTELGGHLWDFVHWHDTSFANQIFSTFGNPNHMAGFLAIVLPAVVIMGLRARRRWWQVAAVVFGLAVLLEILRSAARGAWVAVIASAVVLLVALAPELKRRPALSLGGLAGLLVVVTVGMAAFGRRLIHVPLSSLFQSGGHTPVEQRFEIWHEAARMAAHHPVTGVGPDVFALVWPQYQSAAWVKGLGPNYLVNGAHDIFMNVLADQGFVGLLLFLGLLAYLCLRGVGAWRRLRAAERGGTDGGAAGSARDQRLLLAAIGAGITAYIVQAVFNVQQIGLSFSFWLLLGLLAVVTSAAGVPDTLRPGRLVAPRTPSAPADADEPASAEVPRRRAARRRPRHTVGWPTVVTASAAVAVVAVLSLGADGPWRADHAYWAATQEAQQGAGASQASTAGQQAAAQDGTGFLADIKTATTLNPWEPKYPAAEAGVLLKNAARSKSSAASYLAQAEQLYSQALADEPFEGAYAYDKALVFGDLARTTPASKASYLRDAVAAARNAVRDNPRDTSYQQLLKTVEADQRTGATKL